MGSEGLVAHALLQGAQHSSDLIAVFDSDLRLQWMNPYGCNLLGYELEAIVGEPALSYVHPDDVARVALSIARVSDPTLDLPLKPAPARLRTSSGDHVLVDVNGGGFPPVGDAGGGFFLVCRPDAEAELHAELMELLTDEAPSAKAFALVPAFGAWRQPLLWHGSFHLDDEGRSAATGSAELLALGGLDDSTAPWSGAASRQDRWFGSLDDLEPACRARAQEVGLTNIGAQRVWDALHERYAMAVFAQHAGSPQPDNDQVLRMSQYVLESTARVLGLVLGWRNRDVRLRRAAATDPLTGLANRAGLQAHWERYADASEAFPLTVLSIDLDRFKIVNDTFGHPVGDELLVDVAARLTHTVRPSDVVARVGGDEFVVIAPMLDADGAARMAERIISSIQQPFHVRQQRLEIGASIGISPAPVGTTSLEGILERSDSALYEAKADGRGRWHLRH